MYPRLRNIQPYKSITPPNYNFPTFLVKTCRSNSCTQLLRQTLRTSQFLTFYSCVPLEWKKQGGSVAKAGDLTRDSPMLGKHSLAIHTRSQLRKQDMPKTVNESNVPLCTLNFYLAPFLLRVCLWYSHHDTILPFPSLCSSNLKQWGYSRSTLQLYSKTYSFSQFE